MYGILLLALVIRVVPAAFHAYEPQRITTLDSPAYLTLAASLAESGRFDRAPLEVSVLESPVAPEVFRTPGYPMIIAAAWTLAGPSSVALIFFQILLDLLAVAGCYLVAIRLFSHAAGLGAALLAAIDIPHIVYSNMVMSDVPFAALITGAVLLVLVTAERRTAALAMTTGLALTFATAVRPLGGLLFIPFGAYLLWKTRQPRVVGLCVAASLVFPAVWTVRNQAMAGWPVVSSAHYFNLYYYYPSRVLARATGTSVSESLAQLRAELIERLPRSSPRDWATAYQRSGRAVLLRHPWEAFEEAAISVGQIVLAGERRNLLKILAHPRGADAVPAMREGPLTPQAAAAFLRGAGAMERAMVTGQILWNATLWLLAAVGVWTLARSGMRPELALLACTILYLVGVSFMEGSGRMRLAPSACLFALAAGGLGTVWRRRDG